MVRHTLIAALLLSLTGCATGAMATNDLKDHFREVDDTFGCRGFRLADNVAMCVGTDRIEISIPIN